MSETAPRIQPKEVMSKERLELQRLESEGRFLFHGSARALPELEPRQAYDHVRGADGPPAVFASPLADIAIFHAISESENFEHGSVRTRSGVNIRDNGHLTPTFGISKHDLPHLKKIASGVVYVFHRDDFVARSSDNEEFISEKPVVPVKKILVTLKDLPKNIDLEDYELKR